MVFDIIFLAVSLGIGAFFLVMLLSSSKYDEYIEPLDSKEFMFCEIYGVGFKLLDMFKFDYKNKTARETYEQITILYGEKYADFYLRVYYAQKISLTFLMLSVMCAISSLASGTDKFAILGIAVVVAGVVYYYFTKLPENQIKKRSETFLLEFPNAVSTIALLVNSGMILREAWREVSFSGENLLYFEMRKVNDDIDNGVSEADALYAFANRCVTPEIKKFTSFIVQGLEKGSKDLADALKNQTDELWENKKQLTLQKGDMAASKLLIPLMIMFVGVLIMIMGPIMTNLGI